MKISYWSVLLHFLEATFRERLPSVKTVKSWGRKCLGYKEKEESTILWNKLCMINNLKRHNFNYIFQFVIETKVKIAIYQQFCELWVVENT